MNIDVFPIENWYQRPKRFSTFLIDENNIYLVYDNGQIAPGFPFVATGKFRKSFAILKKLNNNIGSNWIESELQMTNGDYGTPGDDNFGCVEIIWYADLDNDGLGDPNQSILSCEQPGYYVSNNLDVKK